jgi:hypothetical protein
MASVCDWLGGTGGRGSNDGMAGGASNWTGREVPVGHRGGRGTDSSLSLELLDYLCRQALNNILLK